MAKATLYNPETKERIAVGGEGQPTAQEMFGQGYKLETGYDPATGVSTFDEGINAGLTPTPTDQPKITTPAQPDPDVSITPDSLEAEAGLGLPSVEADDTGASIIGEAEQTAKTMEDYIAQFTPPETEATRERDEFQDQLTDLMGEGAEIEEARLEAEEARNLPQMRADFADLDAEIKEQIATYRLKQTAIEGKPITMSSIIGQQAHEEKMHLARIGVLQAQALGMQGQINAAQASVDRAIDIKYSTWEMNLKIYEAQLNMLEDKVSDEERIFLEAKRAMLADEQDRIAEQKATDKAVQNIAMIALANTNDRRIADIIGKATSEVEALQIAGRLATEEGWRYVSTTDEMYKLRDKGYEIERIAGRVYARPAGIADETVNAYVQQIQAGRLNLNSVPADVRNEVAVALGDSGVAPASGGVQGTTQPKGKEAYSEPEAKQLFIKYLEGDYGLTEARERVEQITGQKVRFSYSEARQFVADNPNASNEELKPILLEFVKGVLTITEINALLAERKKDEKSSSGEFDFEDF